MNEHNCSEGDLRFKDETFEEVGHYNLRLKCAICDRKVSLNYHLERFTENGEPIDVQDDVVENVLLDVLPFEKSVYRNPDLSAGIKRNFVSSSNDTGVGFAEMRLENITYNGNEYAGTYRRKSTHWDD